MRVRSRPAPSPPAPSPPASPPPPRPRGRCRRSRLRTAATATPTAPTAATTRPAATGTAAPVYGPPSRDAACAAAIKAEQTLEARQGKDQNNESALDQDFTNFANALSAASQEEKHPATAQAMTSLANDYNDLVESQSGAVQLPDQTQVQNDGAAFEKDCAP